MKKTLYQIYQDGAELAAKLLDEKDQAAIDGAVLSAASSLGHSGQDYLKFKQFFGQALSLYQGLRNQPAPSALPNPKAPPAIVPAAAPAAAPAPGQ